MPTDDGDFGKPYSPKDEERKVYEKTRLKAETRYLQGQVRRLKDLKRRKERVAALKRQVAKLHEDLSLL